MESLLCTRPVHTEHVDVKGAVLVLRLLPLDHRALVSARWDGVGLTKHLEDHLGTPRGRELL